MKKLLILLTFLPFMVFAEYSENKTIDQITIDDSGNIFVRQRTDLIENGKIINNSYHRWSFFPGQEITIDNKTVKDISKSVWTKDIIDKYKDKIKKSEIKGGAE